MSGAGKSTLLQELARRGHVTVDTDYDGWQLENGQWDEPRMAALLADHDDVFVSGTVENQVVFYDRFDHVILLSVPIETLLQRVVSRTTNPYGKSAEQQEEIRRYTESVEPLLRRGATHELDGRIPISDLADTLEQLAP